jgi:adenine-specific DNA-methyltransferase
LTLTNASIASKARGSFFTPPAIADFLATWAIRSPSDSVLEPSCGEAVFLTSAADRLASLATASVDFSDQLVGVEIHAASAAAAGDLLRERGLSPTISVCDFFDYSTARRFDSVLGNPPYIRYQSFTGETRAKGLAVALAQGVSLTRLASSWAAFVIHAASLLKPSGRLGLVLPAELLTVNYAAPVRSYLMRRFARVRLVVFEELVFPGVLEEVVLLLADGQGPTDHFELEQAKNLQDFGSTERRSWTPAETEQKWTPALLPGDAAEAYASAAVGEGFTLLESWGKTSLGMVTGNNKFFALTVDQAQLLGLKEGELIRISPPGSRHLRGLTFTDRTWKDLAKKGHAVFLFYPYDIPSLGAGDYIDKGERDDVHRAYKCRVRSPWWRVPTVSPPDLFFTYMNHEPPRLVANRAKVSFLNSVHGITLKPKIRQAGVDLLPLATLNSITLLGSELVGRAYGGGMLKLEPKEADKLPVPSPKLLATCGQELRDLRPQLALHLRNGKFEEAVKLVDRVIIRHALGLGRKELDLVRSARQLMFGRRSGRGKAVTSDNG